MERELAVLRLGRVEYEDGLKLMKLFGRARAEGLVPDTLLLLEHPPVLTLGRAAKPENVTTPKAMLDRLGIGVFETDRGGDVTYHGPGQIVGYPIFNLAPDRQDVRRYVRSVEEALIRAVAKFGITAGRISKWPGIWIGEEGAPDARKIGQIGVHLSRWLTSHGFALNVRPDLAHFRLIVPCGIREAGVTSMEKELDRCPELSEVEAALEGTFADVFEATVVPSQVPRMRTVSVVALRDSLPGSGGGPEVLLLKRTEARGGFWQPVTGRIEGIESAAEGAARELAEETGAELPVESLDYRHSFALGEEVPPRIVEEHAFMARWPAGREVRIDPTEHSEHAWLPLAKAVEQVPFPGLKEALNRAVRRAASRR